MGYDADAAAARIAARGDFTFTWKGTEHAVPPITALPIGAAKAFVASLPEGDDDAAAIASFDRLPDLWPEDAYQALMETPGEVSIEIVKAWVNHRPEEAAGGDPGKSGSRSPSRSTRPAGTQRKRTSRSAA
ncbi:hypothetical protein [Streptomyces aidingensis]|uniref:Uncharacterized protein n=1 Tax=Streptomyces aidingensis TaxID=910347 RepID=A0A1I1Q3L6_9ACTN|nr:hypothetical protein [Streptomyces aidingensis]SFD14458.1 hypothetical protein SAMN05421773_110118 [Streptomyces aidingensis]